MAAEEGLRIADGIGDGFVSRQCRYVLGWAQILCGDVTGGVARLREVGEECTAAHDVTFSVGVSATRATRWPTWQIPAPLERRQKRSAERASELLESFDQALIYSAFGVVHLAAGDASRGMGGI